MLCLLDSFDRHALELLEKMLTLDPSQVNYPLYLQNILEEISNLIFAVDISYFIVLLSLLEL